MSEVSRVKGQSKSTRPTELLVLGIAHLTDRVQDAALAPAIERLARWKPDVIAVEQLPGELVDAYTREGGIYESLNVGGIDAARELAAIGRHHRSWPRPEAARIATAPETSAEDRVLAWLIAFEPWNALLAADHSSHLPPDVQEALARHAAQVGEVARVAVPLARQLGLDRLHHFDDHTGLECLNLAGQDWWERLCAAGYQDLVEPLVDRSDPPADVLKENIWPYWELLNSDDRVTESEEVESGVLVRIVDAFPVNRIRLAQWRTRNLYMAARLRTITAFAPGGRVLAIVGLAHKRPLHAALSVDQHDLRLVGLDEL